MPRYCIDLSFKGSDFHGWQIQPNAKTVQEELEEVLQIVLQQKVEVVGAGRTDSGVHAKQMIAHFDTDVKIVITEFIFRINSILGKAISINSLREVKSDFHARFDAINRTYCYFIHQKKDPFLQETSVYISQSLDFKNMNLAAEKLIREADFSCFSKSKTQTFTNNCNLTKAEWTQVNNQWVFEVKANRFLRNMVRAIVGTLIEVGEAKRTVESIDDLINSKDRSLAGSSVPAQGLFLYEIEYPGSESVNE